MTTDRRSLGLPVFSESATDGSVPAQADGRRPSPVEQGADFRQPPGEDVAAPSTARRNFAAGGPTFSDSGRPI
ncbi:hypothetical protein [Kitasatospora sp. GP82]|uniref:hypothetical protein n=1 Tax=Kitasatospora sp. GP82 TaxID=3035089 RepID=UPI0024741B3A|nr:hypothetical protein [Kitasatospora sp. GP82]